MRGLSCESAWIAREAHHWIKCSGTSGHPLDVDHWMPRHLAWRREQGSVSAFPRRPRIFAGDRLVNYAVGSARVFGSGRIYMVERVVSEEPERASHERWPWVVEVEHVVSVPRLSVAPELREIGVAARSLSRHSHIRLTAEQGELAERLIRCAAQEAGGGSPPALNAGPLRRRTGTAPGGG